MKLNKLFFFISGVLIIAILIAIPIKVPYSITVPGKILYANEWIISQNADGRIVASLIDRTSSITKNFTFTQFDRGDAVNFTLNNNLAIGTKIFNGDTIGKINSYLIEYEIEHLKGKLNNATAQLNLILTGEKESIIETAKQEVERAKRQSEDLKIILERQKLLFNKGLTAKQEYEMAERKYDIANIDVTIAEARLKSVLTGAKLEEVNFIKTQLNSLDKEINVLENRKNSLKLISPIAGLVTQVSKNDTLLIVSDTTKFIVALLIPLREKVNISVNQIVNLYSKDIENISTAIIKSIDNNVYTINGQQVIIATGTIEPPSKNLLNGLLTQSSISFSSTSPLDFVKKKFSSLIRF